MIMWLWSQEKVVAASLLNHFWAHLLFHWHSYGPWLQTCRVLEDWLNIKNTAAFCISKWKSLEQAIKNGKRVHSLWDETFKLIFFWCKFLWWKPCAKYYSVYMSFETLCMLLSLWRFTKKLQWLQWDFVISWTPHSLIRPWLCSGNHCCWVEHRSLVALLDLAFDPNASCLFLAAWWLHLIALQMHASEYRQRWDSILGFNI